MEEIHPTAIGKTGDAGVKRRRVAKPLANGCDHLAMVETERKKFVDGENQAEIRQGSYAA
jgi:hypothetical protein